LKGRIGGICSTHASQLRRGCSGDAWAREKGRKQGRVQTQEFRAGRRKDSGLGWWKMEGRKKELKEQEVGNGAVFIPRESIGGPVRALADAAVAVS
jgi:hypothetical protein